MKIQIISSLLVCLILAGCHSDECTNTNPVFDNYPVDSKEYRNELVAQLKKNNDKLLFFIAGDTVKNGKHWMLTKIKNNNICARAFIDVSNNEKLTQICKRNVLGYRGAEIEDLSYHIVTDTSGYHLILDNMNRIID